MIRKELENGKVEWKAEKGESWDSVLKKIGKEHFEKMIDDNPELQKFSFWDSVEGTKKNSTIYNYADMIERALECDVKILGRSQKNKITSEDMPLENTTEWDIYGRKKVIGEFVPIFEKFDIDTLKRYHNNGIVYKITKYIIYKRNKLGGDYLCIDNTCPTRTLYERFEHDNACLRMQKDKYRYASNKEDDKMIIWATKYIMDLVHDSASYLDQDNKEIRDYIIKYLQFAKTDDLVELIRLTNKSFTNNKVGRPTNNIPIYVLDRFGNKVARYKNRKECMEKEGLGESYLKQLLRGDKMRRKCRYCEISDDDFNHLEERSKTW